MQENKFLNTIFPVGGGTVAGTIEGANQVRETSFGIIDCFAGVDAAFLVRIIISAIIGAAVGFAVNRAFNAIWPKKIKK